MEKDKELEQLLPHIETPAQPQEEDKVLIRDEVWMNWCQEILNNLRQERQEVDEAKNNFGEMVFNEGDATNASKEALTKLFEIKASISEKMTRVLDLATRIKLKERNTIPGYLAQHYNNTAIGHNTDKREVIKRVEKMQKEENDK